MPDTRVIGYHSAPNAFATRTAKARRRRQQWRGVRYAAVVCFFAFSGWVLKKAAVQTIHEWNQPPFRHASER